MSYASLGQYRGFGQDIGMPEGWEDRVIQSGCMNDSQCNPGFSCIVGRCTQDLPQAPGCQTLSQCPPGYDVCANGLCFKYGTFDCSSNSQCGSNEYCFMGVCEPREAGKTYCDTDGQCPSGQICVAGTCGVPESVDCNQYWDLPVQDQIMCETSGGSCFNDGQCSWLQGGKCYLDQGSPGYCFEGCTDNASCSWAGPGYVCNPTDGLCYPPEPEEPGGELPEVKPPPPKQETKEPISEPADRSSSLMWALLAAGGIVAVGGGIYLAKRKKGARR